MSRYDHVTLFCNDMVPVTLFIIGCSRGRKEEAADKKKER
jgi:hypothetical protein